MSLDEGTLHAKNLDFMEVTHSGSPDIGMLSLGDEIEATGI